MESFFLKWPRTTPQLPKIGTVRAFLSCWRKRISVDVTTRTIAPTARELIEWVAEEFAVTANDAARMFDMGEDQPARDTAALYLLRAGCVETEGVWKLPEQHDGDPDGALGAWADRHGADPDVPLSQFEVATASTADPEPEPEGEPESEPAEPKVSKKKAKKKAGRKKAPPKVTKKASKKERAKAEKAKKRGKKVSRKKAPKPEVTNVEVVKAAPAPEQPASLADRVRALIGMVGNSPTEDALARLLLEVVESMPTRRAPTPRVSTKGAPRIADMLQAGVIKIGDEVAVGDHRARIAGPGTWETDEGVERTTSWLKRIFGYRVSVYLVVRHVKTGKLLNELRSQAA